MGYPTSVFSPATRSNGQTIDASHTNDVQAELTAIENALLGTITHSVNVSGASTFASAQVTNSTLTNAQVANSTFSVRPVEPPPHAVRLESGSTLALVDGQSTAVNWLTQVYITNSSIHSSATDSSKVLPQSTGLWMATFQANFNFNSSGYREVAIWDSSGGVIAAQRVFVNAANAVCPVQVTGTKRFDALGGYLKGVVVQGAASTMSLAATNTWFEMRKL